MESRRELVRHHARAYQRATKGERGKILEMIVQATGYNRVYAARLLRLQGRRVWLGPGVAVVADVRVRPRRERRRRYGPEVLPPLKRIWKLLDYPCGKRLAAAMGEVVRALERHGELRLRGKVRENLLQISASSIDRLLAAEKRKRTARAKSRTKPGSLLKSQIPIRTFAEWDENAPGYLEIDLVAHDGGCAQGDFVQTLDATDVCTGWSEQRAVLNKAQRWVFEALKVIGKRLPFALRGVDSDNGSEFINHHLLAYCQEEQLTFTRSRPYRKNDSCHVEQKNYSVVRRAVGYQRFVGQQAVQTLNTLYEQVALRHNFFLPSMKLREKQRQGSRVMKRYEPPQSPYQRVLLSPQVDAAVKRRVRRRYQKLNPAALDRQIRGLQQRLARLARPVRVTPGTSARSTPAPPTLPSKDTGKVPTRTPKGHQIQIHS